MMRNIIIIALIALLFALSIRRIIKDKMISECGRGCGACGVGNLCGGCLFCEDPGNAGESEKKL